MRHLVEGAMVLGWVVGLVSMAMLILAGCATVQPQRFAGRTIVLKDGTRYPCQFAVQLDSHYRCYKEGGRVFAPSSVRVVE